MNINKHSEEFSFLKSQRENQLQAQVINPQGVFRSIDTLIDIPNGTLLDKVNYALFKFMYEKDNTHGKRNEEILKANYNNFSRLFGSLNPSFNTFKENLQQLNHNNAANNGIPIHKEFKKCLLDDNIYIGMPIGNRETMYIKVGSLLISRCSKGKSSYDITFHLISNEKLFVLNIGGIGRNSNFNIDDFLPFTYDNPFETSKPEEPMSIEYKEAVNNLKKYLQELCNDNTKTTAIPAEIHQYL